MRISCPNCRAILNVGPEAVLPGTKIVCPYCGRKVPVNTAAMQKSSRFAAPLNPEARREMIRREALADFEATLDDSRLPEYVRRELRKALSGAEPTVHLKFTKLYRGFQAEAAKRPYYEGVARILLELEPKFRQLGLSKIFLKKFLEHAYEAHLYPLGTPVPPWYIQHHSILWLCGYYLFMFTLLLVGFYRDCPAAMLAPTGVMFWVSTLIYLPGIIITSLILVIKYRNWADSYRLLNAEYEGYYILDSYNKFHLVANIFSGIVFLLCYFVFHAFLFHNICSDASSDYLEVLVLGSLFPVSLINAIAYVSAKIKIRLDLIKGEKENDRNNSQPT